MKALLATLLTLLLTACATLPADKQAHNQNLTWQQRKTELTPITHFTLRGAVAIRQAKQAHSASLYLQQVGRDYNLQIFGPLGIGRNTLIGKPGSVTLTNSDGKKYHASSPEQLLQTELGWSLPVSNLYFWLRGLPAPHIDSLVKFDAYHHIQQLQQQGWTINYQQYTAVQHIDLPSEIQMRYGQLTVTVIISQWQLDNN